MGSLLDPASGPGRADLRRDGLSERCFRHGSVDAHLPAPAAELLKLHFAVHHRVNGEIAAHADVLARMDLGAALPDDDLAGLDDLAVKALDTQHLRIAIAAVLGTADPFFMRHSRASWRILSAC